MRSMKRVRFWQHGIQKGTLPQGRLLKSKSQPSQSATSSTQSLTQPQQVPLRCSLLRGASILEKFIYLMKSTRESGQE